MPVGVMHQNQLSPLTLNVLERWICFEFEFDEQGMASLQSHAFIRYVRLDCVSGRDANIAHLVTGTI